jgi:tetratricopeptide (TPR) repeat protein
MDHDEPSARDELNARRARLIVMFNLAGLLKAQGKLEESEALFREALEARRETLRPRHPDTISSINGRAKLWCEQGKQEEAETLCREVIEASRDDVGEQGNPAAAEPLYRQTMRSAGRCWGLATRTRSAPWAVLRAC